MQRLYISRYRRTATIKKADIEAILIKGPHRDENSDDKESGCRCYTDQWLAYIRIWMRTAIIKRADAEATPVTGPQRDENGDD